MEIVLMILAGVVVYYLYITLQEYLKNPISVGSKEVDNSNIQEYDLSQDPYIQISPLEKIRKSEFGIMSAMISKISMNNNSPTKLEKILIQGILADMAAQMGTQSAQKDLEEIYRSEEKQDLEGLCKEFLQATYGEYKKRLKFVEFLFALAYSDGKLDEDEKEKVIDIAAFLELDNDDFNKIYDDFEAQNALEISIDKSKALELLELQNDFSQKDLEEKFETKVLSLKQNILNIKNLNKSFALESFPKLREIKASYDLLDSEIQTPQTQESQTQENNPS